LDEHANRLQPLEAKLRTIKLTTKLFKKIEIQIDEVGKQIDTEPKKESGFN
jgi:hypothetical protein